GRLSGAVARGEVAPLRARDLFWSLPIRRLDDGPLDSLTRAVGEIEPMLESVNEASSKDDRDREQVEAELRAKIAALARWEWSAAARRFGRSASVRPRRRSRVDDPRHAFRHEGERGELSVFIA